MIYFFLFKDDCEKRSYLWSIPVHCVFENFIFPYSIKEWNKLDPEIRNAETYVFFRKTLINFVRSTGNYDPLGIKLLLTRLRVGYSHFSEHKCWLTEPAMLLSFGNWVDASFSSTLPSLYYFTQRPFDWTKKY